MMRDVDFTFVLINMLYEPWFWVIIFFGIGFGLMAISYLDKSGRNTPPDDGV